MKTQHHENYPDLFVYAVYAARDEAHCCDACRLSDYRPTGCLTLPTVYI